jgi:crotonobetainyl-CoA:carnitine CoA-transferase CaiB-like acyl-CoA transferase
MTLPLEGLLVLDFSTLLPGPLATFMLAEAGAEVIKVERPGGEDLRRFPPHVGSTSAAFAALNGGKRSLCLDLKTEEGRAALRPSIGRADILVEQFRPGTMERLGLGYEQARTINPRLIYCSVTGYGQTGPRAGEAGHDINYQAVTGLLSLSPGSADAPATPPALVADIAGGAMPAVLNILLALRRRDLTGEGAHLDIAMADAMFTFAWFALAEGHATGRLPGAGDQMLAGGSPRYGLYATRDGQFLAVGALEDKFWAAFCDGIGLSPEQRDPAADPRRAREAVAAIIRERDGAVWRDLLEPLDCCCTLVATLEEARRDPHFIGRGLFARTALDGAGRSLPAVSVPIAPVLRRPPDEPRRVPDVGGTTGGIGEEVELASNPRPDG